MTERTAKKHARLREIAEEILIDPELSRYTQQVAEIVARYDIGERQAKNYHSEAQRYLPEVVARRANEIRARAVVRADVALTKAMDVAVDATELSKVASASATIATTLEKIDPTQWLTKEESVTAILAALAEHDLTEEQRDLMRRLYQRLRAQSEDEE